MKKRYWVVALLLIVSLLCSGTVFALECEYAIAPQFDYAQSFKNGTAAVTKDGVLCVTDSVGNLACADVNAKRVRANGLVMVVGDNGLAAFFNAAGYRLTDYVYDAFPVTDAKTQQTDYRFSYYDGDGKSELVPFSRGKRYGFINAAGVEVIPPKYGYAYGFVDGMALVCDEGVLSVYGSYTEGKYGVILEDGTEILPANSYWVGSHVSGFGYCMFYNGTADKTLVDRAGNILKVDENGYAAIDADYILCEAADGRKGIADRNGNFILPLGNYQYIDRAGTRFVVDEKLLLDTNGNTLYAAKENEKISVHYINIYDRSPLFRLSVQTGSHSWERAYGLMDAYGTVLFEPLYSAVYDIGEGLVVAQKDGVHSLYSSYGELLCTLDGNNVGECVNGLFPICDSKSGKYGYMLNPLLHPKVYVGGEKLAFDVYPRIENGRTLVPLRGVFEAMGAAVSWDGDTQTVTVSKGEITVTLQIGSNLLYKNGEVIEIDVPAKLENSRTLIPLRAVSEALSCEVGWDGVNRVVNITVK